MIAHSTLATVLWEVCGIDQSESDDLAKKIISGLYREMRKEETPKPVLLLAACEVLTNAMARKNTPEIELVALHHRVGDRDGGPFEVFFKLGDTESVDSHSLADAFVRLADGLPL